MQNNRLVYIDLLRGFAILTVIIAHTLGATGLRCYFFNEIGAFFMPLFFVVSGYVNYDRYSKTNGIKCWSRLIVKKSLALLVPFFSVGYLFILTFYAVNNENFSPSIFLKLFETATMWGYWFLFVLWQMEMLIVPLFLILNRCLWNKKFLTPVAFLLYILGVKVLCHLIPNEVLPCTYFTGEYFLYFLLGMYLKFNKVIENSLDNKWVNFVAFSLILYFSLTDDAGLLETPRWITIPRALAWIAFLWGSFKSICKSDKLEVNKTSLKTIKRLRGLLVLFGNYSLQIYVFHYFLLFGLSSTFPDSLWSDIVGDSVIMISCVILFLSFINAVACVAVTRYLDNNAIIYFLMNGKSKTYPSAKIV